MPFATNLTILLVAFSITLTGIASTTSLNFALLSDPLRNDSRDAAKAMALVVAGANAFGMTTPIETEHAIAAAGSYAVGIEPRGRGPV
ncbi:MAG: hypothetical protein WCA53_26470 [Caballeronia sp.]